MLSLLIRVCSINRSKIILELVDSCMQQRGRCVNILLNHPSKNLLAKMPRLSLKIFIREGIFGRNTNLLHVFQYVGCQHVSVQLPLERNATRFTLASSVKIYRENRICLNWEKLWTYYLKS
jgi:hypothetical protein